MKEFSYLLIACAMALVACNPSNEERSASTEDSLHHGVDMPKEGNDLPDDYSTDNSPSFVGTYQGVLPCESCEGTETEIQLFPDSTYLIRTHSQGSDDQPTVKEGNVAFGTGSLLTLEGVTEESNKYYIT